jgi:predicted nucleic acid-binding protein
MRVALDTNILAYVEGVNAGDGRQDAAVTLLQELPEGATVPVQALGELYNVLVHKLGWPGDRARAAVVAWRDAFALAPTSETTMMDALPPIIGSAFGTA